ncbi:GNAT family N-acetyltransferase [Vibrio rhodolitus]|uniref:GNAT family N-acetyltransferase n=1 Tax=Vibrio rhodolitus TaxID=2231649 RepID=UPI000E0A383B|nr:GNAT family N-acetyltransferase [Vibrio rhodolitus]
MEVRAARIEDIEQIVTLQESCHVGNLDLSEQSDGFLNTVIDADLLAQAIEQEQAIFVAELDQRIIAMAACASWQFWQCSTALTNVAKRLDATLSENIAVNSTNSYFWGPVCVDKTSRGQGVFEQLFNFSCAAKSSRFRYVYTYVHEDNARSFAAHTKKVGFRYTKDFELNAQIFREMTRETRPSDSTVS